MSDPAPKSEAEVVESLFRHWAELEVKKDLEAWLELVADDAVLQPAGEPAIVGKNAIRDWFVRFFEIPVSAMEPGPLTVFVSESGDLACNYGNLRMVVDGPGGPVNRCVNEIRRQPPVWSSRDGCHSHIGRPDKRLEGDEASADDGTVSRQPAAFARSPLSRSPPS